LPTFRCVAVWRHRSAGTPVHIHLANLSDELSRSKGVICPPAEIDPGISAPLIGGGVMPIIPPPGTPGGDPNIIPK
jgi:hypothetical protein